MPSVKGFWHWFDIGPKMDESAELADGDVVLVNIPVPFDGTIRSVKFCADVLPTAGTVKVEKAVGSTDTTVVSAVTLQSALTANVGYDATLSSASTALRVSENDMIRCTWTFTTIGSGEGFGGLIAIEPDTW